MRVRKRQDARLIFGDEIREGTRIAGGLREQRKQLREQVAGAMPQLADHQLVSLVCLASLNRPRDDVGEGSQKRNVILPETPAPRGVRTKYPVGASVAPSDRHAGAADDAVLQQQ